MGRPDGHITVPNFDFRDIQKAIGKRFTAALIDCEGCLKYMDDDLLQQVDLIIIEDDNPGEPLSFTQKFRNLGFECKWIIADSYNSFKDPLQIGNLTHSAWTKIGSQRKDVTPCKEWGEKHKMNKKQI